MKQLLTTACSLLMAASVTQAEHEISHGVLGNGGGPQSGVTHAIRSTIGQPLAGSSSSDHHEVVAGFLTADDNASIEVACEGAAGCADIDLDATRDDNCIWWECLASSCADTALTQFADMGGAFGACPPDGYANIHDRNHALSCFSGTTSCDSINIDAGGPFGTCEPDGFCNIHDANHALSAFAGQSTCSCPSGPLPEFDPPVAGAATLRSVASERVILPGSQVEVRVFIEGPVDALLSYQLQTTVSGGKSGALELVDITIDTRKDSAFVDHDDAFSSFNTNSGQMLSGLGTNEGIAVKGEAYLATFTYEASKDAHGKFLIDLVTHDDGLTYLVAPNNGEIQITRTDPAVVTVSKRQQIRERR